MVWVFSSLSLERLHNARQLAPWPLAQYSSQTGGSAGSRSWRGPSALAQPILHRLGAVQPGAGSRSTRSVPDGLITNWRAGCGKSASPVRRQGQRELWATLAIWADLRPGLFFPTPPFGIVSISEVRGGASWLPLSASASKRS